MFRKQDEPAATPWKNDRCPEWDVTVRGWDWRRIGIGEWEKSGPCPSCGHEMKVEQSGAWTSGAAAADARKAKKEPDYYARCNCGEEHPGRPLNVARGCGHWGLIDAPPRA